MEDGVEERRVLKNNASRSDSSRFDRDSDSTDVSNQRVDWKKDERKDGSRKRCRRCLTRSSQHAKWRYFQKDGEGKGG